MCLSLWLILAISVLAVAVGPFHAALSPLLQWIQIHRVAMDPQADGNSGSNQKLLQIRICDGGIPILKSILFASTRRTVI